MATPNNIDDIIATTINNYSDMIADNVTNNIPLFFALSKSDSIETFDGGRQIEETISYAENGASGFYRGYESHDVSDTPTITGAQYAIKQFYVNVTMSGLEMVQNRSNEAIFNLMAQRMQNAEATFRNQMSTSIYSDGTAQGGRELDGLQLQVADDPTSGTVGGIDRASFAFWRNKIYDFSVEGVTPSSTTMVNSMDVLWRRCIRNADKPTIIVAGETYYGFFKSGLQANERFSNTTFAEAGFENTTFNGSTPVIFDSDCAATRMYFLNTNSIRLRPSAVRNFVAEPEKRSTNQDAKVMPMYWAGNLTMNRAEANGVMIA